MTDETLKIYAEYFRSLPYNFEAGELSLYDADFQHLLKVSKQSASVPVRKIFTIQDITN